ncbi:hypothetical protein ACS0TY_031403 [Phlomoides rotata]
MKTMSSVIIIVVLVCLNLYADGVDYSQLRRTTAKKNMPMPCILVFGDSSVENHGVDTGNNNRLNTTLKSNFLPYGEDFFNGQPSGRFCNGSLSTDFIAEAFGLSDSVKAFLDPAITKNDLMHGVSFASAASGYDELTANISNVLSISKQLEYFRHYKVQLRNLVGAKESKRIIHNALVFLSMGTNDFIQNYYIEPTRSKQYNIEQYLNYLISCMRTAIKTMHSLGARKVVVIGVPPFRCMPLVRTFRGAIKCDIEVNKVAFSFNLKIQRELKTLQAHEPCLRSIYLDVYTVLLDAVQNPKKYG